MKTTEHQHGNRHTPGAVTPPWAGAAARTLLFIGPDGVFPAEQAKARGLELHCVDNYLQARHWLEKSVRDLAHSPYAVICDVDLGRAGDYSLVEVIRRHEALRMVPFIVISPEGEAIEHRRALALGIDDYYRGPVVWDEVFARIDFLTQFKRDLSQGNPAHDNKFDGRVPASKRVFDILVAAMLLVLLSPLMAFVALLIRLESRGPILYVSKRAGSGYDIFDFYKFRSMRPDADAMLEDLKHLNQYETVEGEDATFIKIENDPRITRIGRFIRNTSIDELPQLFNVLKGDMSIVGNRPLPLYEAEMLTHDGAAGRFLAPAGITGLWQITRRGGEEMSISERIALDLEYANNFSLLYDFQIIARTIPAMIQQASV